MKLPPVQIKICGLTRAADARDAAAAGADFLGVVLAPGGRRSLSAGDAAGVLGDIAARRVGVFVNQPTGEMVEAAGIANLSILQLHGDESPQQIAELRSAGDWAIWKAIRPRSGSEFLRAIEPYAGRVDGLLLDGWSPIAPGGTGTRFPWAEVARFRACLGEGISLIAAGGMHADNVADAVELLRPHVVDVSSGVERAPGIKDDTAVRAFLAAARKASLSASRSTEAI